MRHLKKSLSRGGTVFGPFLKLSNPAVVEILGHAGFDFVIIDLEHGPLSIETAENLVRAAHLMDISPIIRIRENNPTLISRALDIGAEGIQVPQVLTKRCAHAVVNASNFAPEGERGVCRFVRAARYSYIDKTTYFNKANQDTIVIIQIEGEEGVRNLEEIIEVDGVDVIFMGPYDLSQSLGVPGEVANPIVTDKMKEVIQEVEKSGRVIGVFADGPEDARKWADMGVQFIAYSVDVAIFYEAAQKIIRELKA